MLRITNISTTERAAPLLRQLKETFRPRIRDRNEHMDAPSSFWTLAMRFHQDVLYFVGATDTAIADYLVQGLSFAERQELADFLDKILAMPDAGRVLLGFWRRSKADFGFTSADHINKLFVLIRNRL